MHFGYYGTNITLDVNCLRNTLHDVLGIKSTPKFRLLVVGVMIDLLDLRFIFFWGGVTAVAQGLRCCATNPNVAGYIPAVSVDFSLT